LTENAGVGANAETLAIRLARNRENCMVKKEIFGEIYVTGVTAQTRFRDLNKNSKNTCSWLLKPCIFEVKSIQTSMKNFPTLLLLCTTVVALPDFIKRKNRQHPPPLDLDDSQPTHISSYIFAIIIVTLFTNFLSPFYRNSELKISISRYSLVTLILYTWLLFSLAIHVVPKLTGRYNVILGTSLFFPLFVASLVVFYLLRSIIIIFKHFQSPRPSSSLLSSLFSLQSNPNVFLFLSHLAILKRSTLISLFTSVCFSLCFSRSTGSFNQDGLVCGVIFSKRDEEETIWTVWLTLVAIVVVAVVVREIKAYSKANRLTQVLLERQTRLASCDSNDAMRISNLNMLDYGDDDLESNASITSSDNDSNNKNKIRPQNTLAMVPWYSLLLFGTAFDLFVQLNIFLNRFDARTMQLVKQEPPVDEDGKQKNNKSSADKGTGERA